MQTNYARTLMARFHFECWARGKGMCTDKMPSGIYWDNRTEDLWAGWIAAVEFLGITTSS